MIPKSLRDLAEEFQHIPCKELCHNGRCIKPEPSEESPSPLHTCHCNSADAIMVLFSLLSESSHTAVCFLEIRTKETERKISKKVCIFTSVFPSFAKENSVLQNVVIRRKCFPAPPFSIFCYHTVLQDGRNGPRIAPYFSLSFGVCLLFVLLKLTNHANNLVAF